MKNLLVITALLVSFATIAQRKPLDHTVYDGWQNIGEKIISKNGEFIVYTITPQEGDATLVLQKATGEKLVEIARGYNATIADDNSFVVCKIKPFFQQTRDAKIQKKKADELPKDSMAIINLKTFAVEKHVAVSSYKLPEKSALWLAWQYEKTSVDSTPKNVNAVKKDNEDADNDKTAKDKKNNGSVLLLRNIKSGKTDSIKYIADYLFDKHGNKLLLESAGIKKDSVKPAIIVVDLTREKSDTILKGFNDAKSYAWDTSGIQLAFIAERDSSEKSIQKFYKVFTYKEGDDSAKAIISTTTTGLQKNWCISENANLRFSDSGKRLFFATAPVLPAKDTSLPEFERVSVDIWNYKDDDLMTAQLRNLEKDLQRSYLASWSIDEKKMVQLADESFRDVKDTWQGDGATFYATTDTGRRVAQQWQGYVLNDIYSIDAATGTRTLIRKNLKGFMYPSYTGKYLLIYDQSKRSYQVYNSESKKLYTVAADIKTSLSDEENDVPDDPGPYGMVKWTANDQSVLINDRYDVWLIDPNAKVQSVALTAGRKDKIIYRYAELDKEEKYINPAERAVYRIFDEKDKSTGIAASADLQSPPVIIAKQPMNFSLFGRATNGDNTFVVFTKESFQQSPDLNVISFSLQKNKITGNALTQLSHINPQQQNYTWGSAELFTWKAYTGKQTEGVLYKPDNFDASKKYPMIVYFYERNNTTLNNYVPPTPTPSRLNISFFVSNGYVVFVPDIWYTTGHPGKSAYDYILSGTRALIKKGFIDSTRIGLQGQSWGGYQTAYLITQTTLYKAAWAGAPVSNMFSAYGGIRWESGLNRQMQYERQQSRIGATVWENPKLYMENSPLFYLPKVKTPLVIMANDADGAVPWYQGIELFTDLRRLGKPVWMLNYNNEAHNLMERKNRKDIQIREQQFFDWQLKDKAPPAWITNGVPAIMKGRTLGL